MDTLTCPHCGASTKEHRHSIGGKLSEILETFYSRAGDSVVRLSEMKLGRDMTDNFQKLRYWGLVAKGPKRGWWSVTPLGRRFLHGETSVPRTAVTYRGNTDRFEGGHVRFKTGGAYKQHAEYAADATPRRVA